MAAQESRFFLKAQTDIKDFVRVNNMMRLAF